MMRIDHGIRRLTLCGGLVAALLFGTGASAQSEGEGAKEPTAFEKDAREIRRKPGAATQAQITKVLERGLELGRPYPAHLAAKTYLTRAIEPAPEVMRLAAEAARLSADYRTAVSRYKTYLNKAEPSEQASKAAAKLYRVMIDALGSTDDAYAYMQDHGASLRQARAARAFDGWFLEQARERRDFAAHAGWLARVYGDDLAGAAKEWYYGHEVEWLLESVSRAGKQHYRAAPALKRLSEAIGDSAKGTRVAFYAAYVRFRANRSGSSDAQRAESFASVTHTAEAWFQKAKSVDVLEAILAAWSGGTQRFNPRIWNEQKSAKRDFFVRAFGELENDAARAALIPWRHGGNDRTKSLASPAQWAELASEYPKAFADPRSARRVPFHTSAESKKAFERQAKVLKGVASRDAALINAVAAADSLSGRIDALIKQSSWHLGFEQAHRLIVRDLVTASGRLADGEIGSEARRKALIQLGREHLTDGPLGIFSPQSVAAYVQALWEDADKKADVAEAVRGMAWMPWTEKQRERAFGPGYEAFKSWAEEHRAGGEVDKTTSGAISALESAFKTALDPESGDPEKAPNELTRQLARAMSAVHDGDRQRFAKAARAVYPKVRAYDEDQVPFGEAILRYLLENREGTFDTIDLQTELLADQLKTYPKGRNRSIRVAVETVMGPGWPNWGLGRTHRNQRERLKKVNDALAHAVLRQLRNGNFWPEAFDWFRRTRRGRHWSSQSWNKEVVAEMIEKRTLLETDYRVGAEMAATSYQWLLRHRFRGLRDKYPWESAFDELFVEEAKRTGYLDWEYWRYGRDADGIVVDGAAEVLSRYERMPLAQGPSAKRPAYERGELMGWHARVSSDASAKPRDAFLKKIEGRYGKTRFDRFAMGAGYFRAHQEKPSDRNTYFSKLETFVERASKAPRRVDPPKLNGAAKIGAGELADSEIATLRRVFTEVVPDQWSSGDGLTDVAAKLHERLVKREGGEALYSLVPAFWELARDSGDADFQRTLAGFAEDLQDAGRHELATVYSVAGLATGASDLPEGTRTALQNVRSESIVEAGGAIPVPKSDPRYPVFEAQAAYLGGQVEQAWNQYLDHRRRVSGMIKELDPNFLIWLIEKNTEVGNYERATSLGQKVLTWVDEQRRAFDPGTRGQVLLAYADIAFAKEQYPRARSQYKRVAASDAMEGTRAKQLAQLKIAEVLRVTGQPKEARKRLEKLLKEEKSRFMQTQGEFYMAKTLHQQGHNVEASERLERVLSLDPDHQEARLLQGEINLQLKRYEDVTELPIGISADKKMVIPGEPLKVSLKDKTLQVVGKASKVQIRVWTSHGGDEETFGLFPKGDSKTEFKGEIITEVAEVKKDDNRLQLLGKDTVYYDFSKSFIEAQDVQQHKPGSMDVVSPAKLYASSGEILTEEEREERALEEKIRKQLGRDRGGGVKQRMEVASARGDEEIKPGNAINVRVRDLDRSATGDRDEISVRAEAESGDTIDAVRLKETRPYSGVFEGQVQTASGKATAYASDSQEGKRPNYVISSGDYPAWVGLPDGRRPKTFAVDLNDNVRLNRLSIRANVAGRKLKDFRVETSLDGERFRTVGSWPDSHESWDGSPQLELVRLEGAETPSSLSGFRRYLSQTYIEKRLNKVSMSRETIEADWGGNPAGKRRALNLGRQDRYVAHWKAGFFLEEPQKRSLVIDSPEIGPNTGVSFLMVVDGEPGDEPHKVERVFRAGVHRVDVYMLARADVNPSFKLMRDTEKPPYTEPCPPEMFDPEKTPAIREELYVPPAQVSAKKENTLFQIDFPPNVRARIVRLVIEDFQTDAPAIRSLRLTNVQGEQILPTEEDLLALTENQQLEIVPGDDVTISYQDPSYVQKSEEFQERFLAATYHNAEIEAAFVRYRGEGGQREAKYIPMRRFRRGDKINVFINDPDEDTSPKKDVIRFQASTSMRDGQKKTLEALETGKHTGVFLGTVFPVKEDPKRDSALKTRKGEDIRLRYKDAENTDPGIPWIRSKLVWQARETTPELRTYKVRSETVPEDARPSKEEQAAQGLPADTDISGYVPAARRMIAERPEEQLSEGETRKALVGGPIAVELLYPTIALSPNSETALYAQTQRGREAYRGKAVDAPFNTEVPGTIKLENMPSSPSVGNAPPGYVGIATEGTRYEQEPVDAGRFGFLVPTALGSLPAKSLVDQETKGREEPDPLYILGNDTIHLGYKYETAKGETKWITREVKLHSDPFFHVMNRDFTELTSNAHVGEKLFFRVVDRGMDTTDNKDAVTLDVRAESGATRNVELKEIFEHSGVFKGALQLTYAETGDGKKGEPGQGDSQAGENRQASRNTGSAYELPVKYGDSVTLRYSAPSENGESREIRREVSVYKGADGEVTPFTKHFKNKTIAVQTRFTLAEAYFEQAKRHRKLDNESLARREMAHGRKVLQEAIEDFPDTKFQAHAEYLLAELSLEYAKEADNSRVKQEEFKEAFSRFSEVVSAYPDSSFAPRAQYKKGLVLEKMSKFESGAMDRAFEEYVKLSYKYPDHDLVAETIARLGQYFLGEGKTLENKAKQKDDPIEREKLKAQAREMFATAARVFGRLSKRFPKHSLATKTKVLSGQNYMRAEEYQRAVETLEEVYENPDAGARMSAMAMYWAADANYKNGQMVPAYETFKKLTWDYPESKWAKYARGRLTDEAMIEIAKEQIKPD